MRMKFSFVHVLVLCFTLAAFAVPAGAQYQFGNKKTERRTPKKYETGPTNMDRGVIANPKYRSMARAVIEQPPHFDFMTFRSYYAGTDQYDPVSEAAKARLLEFAYAAQTSRDPAERTKALNNFGDFLALHLANLDIVNQSLVLSEQDHRFGNPVFFRWLRDGLVNAVVHSGTGASLFLAYDVVTIGEEGALLKELDVQVLDSKNVKSGTLWYNMHTVRDAVHKQPYTVFVDVTVPMAYLDYKNKSEGRQFSIPRQ